MYQHLMNMRFKNYCFVPIFPSAQRLNPKAFLLRIHKKSKVFLPVQICAAVFNHKSLSAKRNRRQGK